MVSFSSSCSYSHLVNCYDRPYIFRYAKHYLFLANSAQAMPTIKRLYSTFSGRSSLPICADPLSNYIIIPTRQRTVLNMITRQAITTFNGWKLE